MNRICPRLGLSLFVSSLVIADAAPPLYAYDAVTHGELAVSAAIVSSVEQTMRDALGLRDGLRTPFSKTLARDWVRAGATLEDEPPLRPFHHFHNPLVEPWEAAGLDVGGLAGGQSSALWQQNPSQHTSRLRFIGLTLETGGGNWSWQDARRRYRDALTGASRDDRDNSLPPGREQTFAELFQNLGQLTHLVQDAAVPAHVRNDAHPFLLNPDWYEDGTKRIRENDFSLFTALLNPAEPPPAPTAAVFTPTGRALAPVPIARLIDTDAFRGDNPDVLARRDLGVAEYTNGNFLSRDTLFTRFALPRPASITQGPLVPDGSEVRRYFRKVGDGEVIEHFVAEGMLHQARSEVEGGPSGPSVWMLDDRVHLDYAARLLPRAVAYSAALLDYFFRGRLDLELIADPDDPSVVRLTGTNASPERLDGGALRLYADDPEGRRSPAVALDPTLTVTAEPGAPLGPARFRLPATDPERFIAVYQGRLGDEVPVPHEDPRRDFPGAVIGKVLGGVRVEEIFAGAEQWQVRTPRGVFALPLAVAAWEEVRWGDGDDRLVARGSAAPGAPVPVVVYEVERLPGSADFVLAGQPPTLQLTERRRGALPFEVPPLVTTVRFSQTIRYRQQIGRYASTTTRTWHPQEPFGPSDGFYTIDVVVDPPVFETVHEASIPFVATIPVRLDREHSADLGSLDEPYVWWFTDIVADRAGRPLGLAVVYLTTPPGAPVEVPLFVLDDTDAPVESGQTRTFGPSFPFEVAPLLWALVDLVTGEVLASTAEPEVVITSVVAREGAPWDDTAFGACPWCFPGLHVHHTMRTAGGPEAGTTQWRGPVSLRPRESEEGTIAEVESRSGDQALTVAGWLRAELRDALSRLGLLDFGLGTVTRFHAAWNFNCLRPPVCPAADSNWTGLRGVWNVLGTVAPPVQLFNALRARPAPAGERIVFLGDADRGGRGPTGHLVVWDPAARRAEVRLQLPPAFHDLAAATGSTALVWRRPFDAPAARGSYLVSLDSAAEPTFFPLVDFRSGFTLLEPGYLYRFADQRFYRLAPPLQSTLLPARLAEVAGNPFGDYHLIRLP